MFDVSGADTSSAVKREILPKGKYNVSMVEAELTNSKAGDPMFKLAFQVLDGPHAGRRLFDIALLRHANEMAQSLGQAKIKRILECTGNTVFAFSTEEDFKSMTMGKPMTIDVGTSTYREELTNKVSGYNPYFPAGTPQVNAAAPAPIPQPTPVVSQQQPVQASTQTHDVTIPF